MSGQPIDIRPDHEALVRNILLARLPRGVRVWVFGSRAKWLAKPYSDLDLALKAAEPLPDDLVANLKDDFTESDLPWKVDVLDLNAIDPSFRAMIDEDRVAFSLREKVMGEWANHRLADVIELIGGGTPKRSRPDYWGGDIPWLSVKDFNDDKRYICSVEETITEDGLNNSSTKILKPGQIIISARGTVGALAQIAHPMAFNQSCYGINANTKFTTNDYVFYLLQDIVPNLQNIAHGAVFDTITRDTFQLVDIKLPPLPEQRTIAAILGSLDDKIDLNRRMNETLEAIARAIFKNWFVDFGPTRAKMEGRKPYLAPEIWQLFPDRLGEDGKPEGWEMKPITGFLTIIGGGTPKTSVPGYWNGTIPWFSVADTPPSGSVFVVDTEKTITEMGLAESSARLIPKGTTIISARGTVGNLAVAGQNMTFNQSCYALRGYGAVGDCFVYLVAKNMVRQLQLKAHGSVFSTITRQTFEAITLPLPCDEALRCFESSTVPLFDKILALVKESQTLAQTRDLLLPKLMSGEIRVREAEKLTGDVV